MPSYLKLVYLASFKVISSRLEWILPCPTAFTEQLYKNSCVCACVMYVAGPHSNRVGNLCHGKVG